MESGTAFAYAIDKLQDRGKFFIFPQDEVYAGQVVGEHSHDNDLVINVTKSKKLTNMRASGSDDKVRLIPPIQFSLEEALEYIKEDEYVEVTPKAMRMRKGFWTKTKPKLPKKKLPILSLYYNRNPGETLCFTGIFIFSASITSITNTTTILPHPPDKSTG